MSNDLARSLALRIQPANDPGALEASQAILLKALESYGPSTLNELYMAVRAVMGGDENGLVETLRSLAEQAPDRPLVGFTEDCTDL